MEKTAYHEWLYIEGHKNPVIIASLICNNYLEDNNPQAAQLVEATGDKGLTAGTFYRAAQIVIDLCEMKAPHQHLYNDLQTLNNYFQ